MAVNYKNRVVVNCATQTAETINLTDEEIAAFVARDKEHNDALEKNAPDHAWAVIRQERDSRLAATDYFSLNDVTLTDAMKTYRDNLRKVPQTTSDPVAFQTQWNEFEQGKDGVSDPWPTKPE